MNAWLLALTGIGALYFLGSNNDIDVLSNPMPEDFDIDDFLTNKEISRLNNLVDGLSEEIRNFTKDARKCNKNLELANYKNVINAFRNVDIHKIKEFDKEANGLPSCIFQNYKIARIEYGSKIREIIDFKEVNNRVLEKIKESRDEDDE